MILIVRAFKLKLLYLGDVQRVAATLRSPALEGQDGAMTRAMGPG